MSRIIRIILGLSGLLAGSATAFAAPALTVTQALAFGTIFLKNNDAVYSATITPLGILSYDSAFLFMGHAKNAAYSLSGADPDMDINVSFDPSPLTLSCSCGSPDLTLDNFTISPVLPHTNLAGHTTFKLGATLLTSGSGPTYGDGAYSGTVTINLDY